MNKLQVTVDIYKAELIPGWMSEGELLWLAARAREFNKIVEFGSFHGRSTRALADNCEGTIWAVDPWAGKYPDANGNVLEGVNTYVFPHFYKNLEDHIVSGRVIPVRGYSHSFKLPHTVDMVFIDGDHRYESVLKDIDVALRLLRSGGMISGHDYDWDSVKAAVHDKLGSVSHKESIWFKTKF